jgi:hypothetical protein
MRIAQLIAYVALTVAFLLVCYAPGWAAFWVSPVVGRPAAIVLALMATATVANTVHDVVHFKRP